MDEFPQVFWQAEQMLVARQWVDDHREDSVRGHEAGSRMTRANHPKVEHVAQRVGFPALEERPGVVAEIVTIALYQNCPYGLGIQRGAIADKITPTNLVLEIIAEVKAAN